MNFRRKRIKGQNKKVRRTWLSDQGYRIVWRKEVYGVRVPARFQATVRTILPNGQTIMPHGQTILPHGHTWDFVGRRLFKTIAAAQDACEKHEALWAKAAGASGVRQLQEIFGRVPLGFPAWVKSKLNRNVYGILMDTSAGNREEPCGPPVAAPAEPAPTKPEEPTRKRAAKSSKPGGKRRKSTSHSKVTAAKSSRGPRRKIHHAAHHNVIHNAETLQ